MRLQTTLVSSVGDDLPLPLWPPLLATRGPGTQSEGHAHHAMHLVFAVEGSLRVRAPLDAAWQEAAGVLTAPDVAHALDGSGVEVLLVFVDPESEVGVSLRAVLTGAVRLLSSDERDRLREGADPRAIMRAGGVAFTQRVVETLGAPPVAGARRIHPRVRKLLRLLRTSEALNDTSLGALAAAVGLSPSRIMHVFTESVGVPLRPYLAWLRLQRAAGAIVAGHPLAAAAAAAGFADAAHMSRAFRRTLGMSPSLLRRVSSPHTSPQPVRSRPERPRTAR